MTVILVTFSPKGVRKEFPLGDKPLLIGRGTEADIRIPLDEISRTHCEVSRAGGKVIVKDLSSRNGTFVNDQKIAQATLKGGDHLRAGSVVFTVQIDGVPKEIGPVSAMPTAPAAGSAGKPSAPTAAGKPSAGPAARPTPAKAPPADEDDEESFDIDGLEELGSDDLSDVDIDDLVEADSDEIEEIDHVVDLSDEDIIANEDEDTANGR
jgi:predicted component of type VI protein secretion system